MHKKLMEATAKWEMKMPLHMQTVVQHFLLHVLAPKSENGLVLNNGPSTVTGMLTAERMNKTLKSLTKATQGICEGIARSYGVLGAMEMKDVECNPEVFVTPKYLRSDITIELVDETRVRGGLKKLQMEEGGDMWQVFEAKWEETDPAFRAARAVPRYKS
jgi:hypothetical protein